MSFKRDGDDRCALENLRKRRIGDLLYEDIQEGEVSKLRNGRYLCKVCQHCPTFDTLNMFQVHKQGKKHKQSLEYQEIERQELQDLVQKRQHENMVAGKGTSHTQTLDTASATDSVKPAPYDPRSKRHKTKPYARRTVLDLDQSNDVDQTVETTDLKSLPGHCESLGNEGCHRSISSVAESDKSFLKKNFNQPDNKKAVKPAQNYKTNRKGDHGIEKDTGEIINTKNVSKFIDPTKSETISKHYFARKQKFQTSKDANDFGMKLQIRQDFTKTWDYFKSKPVTKANILDKKPKTLEPVCDTKNYGNEQDCSHHSVSSDNPGTSQTLSTPETKERAEKMLQALGSGWKKDWTGKWIKDEDVEFDSDEEPPDVV